MAVKKRIGEPSGQPVQPGEALERAKTSTKLISEMVGAAKASPKHGTEREFEVDILEGLRDVVDRLEALRDVPERLARIEAALEELRSRTRAKSK